MSTWCRYNRYLDQSAHHGVNRSTSKLQFYDEGIIPSQIAGINVENEICLLDTNINFINRQFKRGYSYNKTIGPVHAYL